ncbi:MAG TPA: hypothetical protein VHV83_01975 [Armatimonadota bacterium]|nr:hypothetical protein [Armatimonadota bacterium]
MNVRSLLSMSLSVCGIVLSAFVSSFAMAAGDMSMPEQFKFLLPPLRPYATIWSSVTTAESNIPLTKQDGTYSGSVRYYMSAAPVGPDGFYVRFSVDVPADRGGKFLAMAACGPIGRTYISPVELAIDGTVSRKVTTAPVGNMQWGISKAVNWVSLGTIELTPGKHTVALIVRDSRQMDKNVAQEFDALALIHEKDVAFPATFTAAKRTDAAVGKVGSALSVPLQIQVASTTLKQPAAAFAKLRLLTNGRMVSEVPVNFEVAPSSTGKSISTTATLPIPAGTPAGTYDLQLIGLSAQAMSLGTAAISE